jgi:hypothetical protein
MLPYRLDAEYNQKGQSSAMILCMGAFFVSGVSLLLRARAIAADSRKPAAGGRITSARPAGPPTWGAGTPGPLEPVDYWRVARDPRTPDRP